MAPHSSTFAWKIPWTEKSGRLQSMGSLESDTTERLHLNFSLSCIGEGNGKPLQCSCLENPKDGEAWWAAVYGVDRVGHDWSDLAAAAAILQTELICIWNKEMQKSSCILVNNYSNYCTGIAPLKPMLTGKTISIKNKHISVLYYHGRNLSLCKKWYCEQLYTCPCGYLIQYTFFDHYFKITKRTNVHD